MKKRILPVIGLAVSIILSVFIMTSNCEAFSSVYAEEGTPRECMEPGQMGGDFEDIDCRDCPTPIDEQNLVTGTCTSPPPAPQPE